MTCESTIFPICVKFGSADLDTSIVDSHERQLIIRSFGSEMNEIELILIFSIYRLPYLSTHRGPDHRCNGFSVSNRVFKDKES